ncbi:MAG TPA: cytochrome c3 family protein [Pyrinomonadaceae bacterium]|nr:cytochrome c3 family protein [Pyrinomonadaceae bacterium]
MKHRFCFSLLTAAVLIFAIAAVGLLVRNAAAQRRRPRRPIATAKSAAGVNYAHFSHATKKHQAACNTCHKAPTSNWEKASGFPDVADFPDHEACVGCHRAQFFRSDKPAICSDCHMKVSPRDSVRFAFRNPASSRQFVIEFPHDKHQDVIARLLKNYERQGTFEFTRASYNVADEKNKHFNNCEICHQPRAVPTSTKWPDAFLPAPDTFKAAPLDHASCFNCHWQRQQPVSDNCGGCHKLAEKPYAAIDAPPRISLKFRHGREQHIAECTTCHINITKSATLRGLKPDVPITACTECHNKDGLRLDLSKELVAIDRDPTFTCSYCHTSEVGRRDPPAAHYLIAGMKPKKRAEAK